MTVMMMMMMMTIVAIILDIDDDIKTIDVLHVVLGLTKSLS